MIIYDDSRMHIKYIIKLYNKCRKIAIRHALCNNYCTPTTVYDRRCTTDTVHTVIVSG